ncbi:hypothetical protein NDN08_007120 [Rhodosorus marinus]|uniref:DnaJ homologue subfamily C member 28 conserved domain-containing protein n=1 Tax=Rhodosorus marinus TaxID=101924 RepID=A0AAV8UKV8_9RHOD|nr:hypothetical protein NDN08_007120 [Rhodosorus marinus]
MKTMFHGRPELAQQLRSANRSVRTSLERGFADGPAGYGGLYRREGETNPKARRRAEKLSRLENAEWGVEDQKNPPEFRERPRLKSTEEITDYVEGQIQRAIARGEFLRLKKKGKKLVQSDGSGRPVDETFDIAMRIMKDNNLKPRWIELMNEIDQEKHKLRSDLVLSLLKVDENGDEELMWKKEVKKYESRIGSLNKKIDDFNIIKPEKIDTFRLRLKLDSEIERARTAVAGRKDKSVDLGRTSTEEVGADAPRTPENMKGMVQSLLTKAMYFWRKP